MALYIPKYKTIFIHNYKCAGTSIRHMFSEMETEEIGLSHCTTMECREEFNKRGRAKEFDAAFKFTFVRHPYSWIGSLYDYIRRGNHIHSELVSNMSFERFVWWLMLMIKKKETTPNGHYCTQLEFARGVNKFGRLESFDQDIQKILNEMQCSEIIISHLGHGIFHLNRGQDTDYHSRFTDELKAAVWETLQLDFLYLWYSTDINSFNKQQNVST